MTPRTPPPTASTTTRRRRRAPRAPHTPPRDVRGVLQPVSSNDRDMPPLSRTRRLDSTTYASVRKRKRRTPDENAAPTAARASLKRRKSVVEAPEDDDEDDEQTTDAMELDSGASTHEGEESQTQSDEHLIHRAAAWQLRRLRKDALVRLYMLASGPECTPDPSTELTKPELIDALLGARSVSSLPTPSRSPPHTRALKDREIKDLPARPRRRTVSHPAPVPASLSCDGGDEADPDAPSSKRLKLAKRRTVPALGIGAPPAHRVTRTRSTQIDNDHPAFASGSDLTEPDSPIEDTPRALPSPRRLRSTTSRSEITAPASPVLGTRRRRTRTKHQLRTPPSDGDGDDEAGATSVDEFEVSSPSDIADASHVAQAPDDEELSNPEDDTVRVLRNGKVVGQGSEMGDRVRGDEGESSDLTELDSEDEGDITMRPTQINGAEEEDEGEEEEEGDEVEEVVEEEAEEEAEDEEQDDGEMEEDEQLAEPSLNSYRPSWSGATRPNPPPQARV
ncbi:hypothetical protein BDV93DRAFT_18869 [Ceratobasidium sp. AG-I]|nr:hypothetical protein BDV93DRAFT_18869 [Ceratobasidium sp. AG-I]